MLAPPGCTLETPQGQAIFNQEAFLPIHLPLTGLLTPNTELLSLKASGQHCVRWKGRMATMIAATRCGHQTQDVLVTQTQCTRNWTVQWTEIYRLQSTAWVSGQGGQPAKGGFLGSPAGLWGLRCLFGGPRTQLLSQEMWKLEVVTLIHSPNRHSPSAH